MATDQQYDELYKVVLVGDPAVGKTNLLASFLALADDTNDAGPASSDGTAKGFSSVRKPTIGVEFGTKIIQHPDGKRIKAQIWDTAGQERYRAITSSHYRRAAGALLVYDVTNAQSFEHAQQHWLPELKSSADPSSTLPQCIMLVGNKTDLEVASDPTQVSSESHEAAAQAHHLLATRTSARTAQNVQRAFHDLIVAVYEQDKGKMQRMATLRSISLEESKTNASTARGAKPPPCCNV